MASNIKYYAQIKDLLSGNEKTFNLDTTLSNQQSSVFSVSLNDDIYNLYPYGIFVLKDSSGVFFSDFPFAEGHKYRITLGYIDDSTTLNQRKFVTGEYYWSKLELALSEKGSTIAGETLHYFTYHQHIKDGITTSNSGLKTKRYYSNKKASEVVRSIITPDFIKDDKYVLINETKGSRDWYLSDYSLLDYIEKVLTKYAIALKNESPYYTFFNLKNEFHFRSAFDLHNNKPLPPPDFYTSEPFVIYRYTLNFNNQSFASDPFTIVNYSFIYIGTEEYQRLISVNNYTSDIKDGKYKKLSTNLADQIFDPLGKLPIKSPNFLKDKRENNLRDVKYHGLHKDSNFFKATVYQQYENLTFISRMKITIHFNPETVSGRLIELNCFDFEGKKNTAFSGRWVILKSEHRYELQEKLGNRMILTHLEIGKNAFTHDNDGGYYYDKSLKSTPTN